MSVIATGLEVVCNAYASCSVNPQVVSMINTQLIHFRPIHSSCIFIEFYVNEYNEREPVCLNSSVTDKRIKTCNRLTTN